MFEELFAKFKKNKVQATKISEDVNLAFAKAQQDYAAMSNSAVYSLFTEYFLVKMEMNREGLETLNPYDEAQRSKILALQAENRVMAKFILDIEAMKATAQEAEKL